jgi:hypothetical protein
VEGLGEKTSSSASVFFFPLLICDIKNLAKFSQKAGKLVKFTHTQKKKLSQIFGQKRYEICCKILALYL